MSLEKLSFWNKSVILFLILILMIPVLAACGDDDETPTPPVTTSSATTPVKTAPAVTTPATTTPTISKEPVNIGILTSWSGAAAKAGNLVDRVLKIIDKQLADRGGLNVDGVMRPVKWYKQDDNTQVADAVAGYKKLVLQGVSAVFIGGATAAALTATSDVAEETKVPLFSVGSTPVDLSNRPYTIRCAYTNATDIATMVSDFVLKEFKPETVGLLMANMQDIRARSSLIKQRLEAAGVKVVYEQYPEVNTTDFSSLLTGIRQKNPDVLIGDGGADTFYVNVFKQIPGLGGWGDIKFVSNSVTSSGPALNEKGADGTYHWILWMPGLPFPGSKVFEDAWKAQYSERPTSGDIVMYQTIWVGLKAIEMAGSDKPEDIQKAVRSGNFVWEDAPGGSFHINADGTHNNVGQMVLFKDGVLVPVTE
ncbi:MAG: ABC transporter substrate-binding protein [Dehalococcoidia bacterium]|nr:ABC transporter substrate-binding protein [Dehalococcoidia bacterium]